MDPLMKAFARLPVHFVRGEGAWLWDAQGNRYLDGIAGLAVCSLGHAHPEVTAALAEQARTLVHVSNLFAADWQQTLAARLAALSGLANAFFCNSGAEANEAAIKLARLYAHVKGIERPAIVVTDGAFHGRTLATLSASGNRKIQAGFEPLVEGFLRVPYDDLDEIRAICAHTRNVVAVLVEPIQGERGVVLPSPGYLAGIRQICDEHDLLFLLDEIQTGLCRTGRWFAFQHEIDAAPDVMTLAKALGNGVPIGACLAGPKAADLFQPGRHGTTYGGNPLVCRVAETVLAIMARDGLAARAEALGARILAGLQGTLGGLEGVRSLRGKGLMLGIELDRPTAPLVERALHQGVVVNATGDNVVRLLPPLVLTEAEADLLVERVSATIRAYLAEAEVSSPPATPPQPVLRRA
jgi:acetylornithine aminotransferase